MMAMYEVIEVGEMIEANEMMEADEMNDEIIDIMETREVMEAREMMETRRGLGRATSLTNIASLFMDIKEENKQKDYFDARQSKVVSEIISAV